METITDKHWTKIDSLGAIALFSALFLMHERKLKYVEN